MDTLYQVKFIRNGKEHFGIVINYSPEAEELKSKGILLIEDAILPISYQIPIKDITPIPLGKLMDNEYSKYVDSEFEKYQKVSNAIKGVGLGKLFSIGVGDGCSWYVITKINKKTCKVEWRGFCLDRWVDRVIGYGCSLPISKVEGFCKFDDFLRGK